MGEAHLSPTIRPVSLLPRLLSRAPLFRIPFARKSGQPLFSIVCLLVAAGCFYTTHSIAQAPVLVSKWEIGAQFNQFIYQGDLAPSAAGSTKTPGYGFGIYGDRILNRSLALRTSLNIGELYGDDSKYPVPAWRLDRALSFSTPVYEISEMLVWNILADNYQLARPRLSPYLFGGVGYTFLDIHRNASKFNAHAFATDSSVINGLAADERHALPKAIPVIPIGAGIRYGITPALSVTVEAAYRLTFTDYLDGFSQVANPHRDDRYYTLSVGLVSKFISNDILRCPIIRQ